MSPTHDYVIANGTGSSVRSDINDALAAVVSQNSSSTAPATTYAYMIWVDTTTNIVKMRNGANSAWIELFETDGEFGSKTFNGNITLNAQGDLRFADSDSSNWVAFQSPATVSSNVTWTLPSADGTNGQALTTNGSGTLSWASPAATADKITEGNTEAEVVDTGSDGHFKVTTEGTERFRCDASGRILVGTSTSPNAGEGQYARFVAQGYTGGPTFGGYISLQRGQAATAITAGGELGVITFGDSAGNTFGTISCVADATAGSNDYPGRLVFSTTADGASSVTERMRIDSSGRLLVGTTSGSSKLTVSGNLGVTSTGQYDNVFSNSSSRAFVVSKTTASAIDSNLVGFVIQNSAAGSTDITSGFTQGNSSTSDLIIRNNLSSATVFTTDSTERMRIRSDGRIGVNSPDYTHGRFIVESDCSAITTAVFRDSLGGTGSSNLIGIIRNGTIVGTISTTNTATAYNTSSDYRLKENVVAVTDGITRLQQLKPSRFNFIADPDKTVDGFIAHEVQAVVPEAISGKKDGEDDEGNPIYQGIDQSKLVPLLTAALQEAIAKIESLEARLTAAGI